MFLMIRQPPKTTRTDTLFPYTTRFRAPVAPVQTGISPELLAHRRRLHDRLVQALQLRRRDIGAMSDEALRGEATRVLGELIADDRVLSDDVDREALVQALVDAAGGRRSEERGVGTECVSTCRYRGSQ